MVNQTIICRNEKRLLRPLASMSDSGNVHYGLTGPEQQEGEGAQASENRTAGQTAQVATGTEGD